MQGRDFSDKELLEILENKADFENLRAQADSVRRKFYGDEVFIRGLIEFSNHCKNNCYYCGLRAQNKNIERYRLSKNEILGCCKKGYSLGYRTFVLQSGEDISYSDEDIAQIVLEIKKLYSDCAVTLSIGERSRESYQKFFDAGADRYLLRHETANNAHYQKLHPKVMSLAARKECLFALKEIGFQTGAGFMVGSPYQTNQNIIEDLRFLQDLQPAMIGIGPFVTHSQTPFAEFQNGSVQKTLALLCVLRLMFPNILLPATTALGTLDSNGREKGLQCGANVIMPNLSPDAARKKYSIYDNKAEEAAEQLQEISEHVQKAGYKIVCSRGDCTSLARV